METCGVTYQMQGDQGGDFVTVTCGQPKGHASSHMEVFGTPGERVTVLWTNKEDDARMKCPKCGGPAAGCDTSHDPPYIA